MYLASNIFKMKRITVEITDDTYLYLEDLKKLNGSSVTFEANALIELAKNGRIRKKKNYSIQPDSYKSSQNDSGRSNLF